MREMFLEHGFDDYLTKPIDIINLNTVLEKWLPKEKRQRQTVEGKPVSAPDQLAAIRIEGVDVYKGVSLSGGTVDFYYETLAAFLEDGYEKMEEIGRCLHAGNLPMFATHIHALKSASATIGADAVSEEAYALELAGHRGDSLYIDTKINRFRLLVQQLLVSIEGALTSRRAKGGQAGKPMDAGQLNAELTNLKTAMETLDAEVMNRTVDTLLNAQCPDDLKAVVRKISKHILMVEYDEAEELIDSLLK
jgi:HPt (histidine-containing phosphotransfer) domain-containing protein